MIGRLSAGYFAGNKKVLVDENGNSDEKGVLLSWDRTMTEISDKLWLAVDYQGSKIGPRRLQLRRRPGRSPRT